jgi:hypothetical protein
LKRGSSTDQLGGSHGQTRPRSETLANGEAMPNAEKNLEEVTAKQSKVLGAKTETRIEARTSSGQPKNRIVWFPKPDHPVYQTRPSGFYSLQSEAIVEDYRTRDSSITSLVSPRPHVQPEEEDPADEGVEDEGRSGWEGER